MLRAVAAALLTLWASSTAACTVDAASLTPFQASITVDRQGGGQIRRAWFDRPTDRYDHGILGDAIEAEELVLYAPALGGLCGTRLRLDENHVFEDTAPRLIDLTGDGNNEVIVVRTHLERGAQLAIFGLTDGPHAAGLIATTPYIGRTHRWLAPLAAGDFDGDGLIEIAYIDRPHLARTLRIVRLEGNRLVEVASLEGLTNHRIGERTIGGGLRDCGQGPEMIAASGNWQHVMAITFADGQLSARQIGRFTGPESFARALACR